MREGIQERGRPVSTSSALLLILSKEDCLKDIHRRLSRNVDVGGSWSCDGCGQEFEDFRPHVHGGVRKWPILGEYVEAFCSEGCAIAGTSSTTERRRERS